MPYYFFNADDYGISNSVNLTILRALQDGKLQNTSVMPNFTAAEDLLNISNFNSTNLRVHLNLLEGKCLSNPADIPDLVDTNGLFKRSLSELYFMSLAGKTRLKFLEQVYMEFCNQIEAIYPKYSSSIQIDGHLHIHCIPGFLPVIKSIIKKYPVSYVRIPNELRHIPKVSLAKLPTSILRRETLSSWSKGLSDLLKKLNIKTSDYFIGSYASGYMDINSLSKSLKKVLSKNIKSDDIIEIMIHPHNNSLSTKKINQAPQVHLPYSKDYYLSINRRKELDMLYSSELVDVLNKYNLTSLSFFK